MTAISLEVLSILSACTFDGAICRLPDMQLDRKLYLAVNKVLEGLGGHWDKKARGHVFSETDAAERLDEALLTGSYERTDLNAFDFYPTPSDLAQRVIGLANLRDGMKVLEPSAGAGALAFPAAAAVGAENVTAIEIDDAKCRKLRNGGLTNVLCDDFLLQANGGGLTIAARRFGAVVMNPPFSRGRDALHVTEALKYLASNGLLVAIMSAGVTFRQNRATVDFRAMVAERGGSITPNPAGSFKPSGTNVNTVTVAIPGGAL